MSTVKHKSRTANEYGKEEYSNSRFVYRKTVRATVATYQTRSHHGLGFLAYGRQLTAELAGVEKPVAVKYRVSLNRFAAFLGHGDVLLSKMDASLIARFELWLSMNVCRNTSSCYMRNLQAIYGRAVDAGLVCDSNPFRDVYRGVDETRKRALVTPLVRQIRDADLSASPKLAFARDMFMLAFYLRGISFIDMAFLRHRNLSCGILSYRRKKTGQLITIKWNRVMATIVDRYAPLCHGDFMLPLLPVGLEGQALRRYCATVSQRINRRLCRLGSMLQISVPLTMYVARHSWATTAYSHHVPVSVICRCMGHDNEKTTRIYLESIDMSEMNKADRVVIKSLDS